MKTNEDIFKNEELLNAVEQLKKGNDEAFVIIYNKTYNYVYSRAKYMFKDEQEALDLVQEVYLSVYRNIDSLKSNESLYAWLRTVTFQQGTKLLRKNRKEMLLTEETQEFFDDVMDDGQETGKELFEQEDTNAIRECIDRLSDEQRAVVLAYYYDNLKVDEIAKIFEISVGTAKSRLHLARKNLKLYIEEQEKKQGYKLHSFGGFTFAIALSSMMKENMKKL